MSYNEPVASRPTERELDLELVKLVDWQVFATHLPGLERENIEQIQRNNHEVHLQKLELFGTWLRIQPDASWKDVVLALEKARENTLAEAVKKKFKIVQDLAGANDKDSTMETTPITNMSNSLLSRPTESRLDLELTDLVHWQRFATHLPGVTKGDIEEIQKNNSDIKRQKLELFAIWLRRCLSASWEDVILALKKARENTLTVTLGKCLATVSSLSTDCNSSKISNTPHTQTLEINCVEEKEILDTLQNLHKCFVDLVTKVKQALEDNVHKGNPTITVLTGFIQTFMHWENMELLVEIEDLNQLFAKLHRYFDFLECGLIVAITNEYIQGELATKMKEYRESALQLRRRQSVKNLKNGLRKFYTPHLQDTSKMPEIYIQLNKVWEEADIEGLYLLVKYLLPKTKQQSLLEHITIDSGSVLIKYRVEESYVDYLIAYAENKPQFMRLIGIFGLVINNIPILQEDANKNFTFDSALLESSQSGNNEAVQFLLDLGVNINYSNSEGKTALLLACEAGHEEIVQTLVSAKANVDLQDSAGQTALMLASGHIGIIRLLLAKADLDIQQQDGNTALHIACYRGHNTVIELLLSYHASPVIKNTKDDTPFMASLRGNNADILKLMLNAIPSSHLSSGIVLACRLGHSAVFSLLVKQLECTPQVIDLFISCAEGDVGSVIQHIMEFNIDPNTTLISGITPLMIASSCGHVEVIDTLIQMEADVNRIDTDNYSPLAYAITGNKSLPTVQYLLEAGANPHVLLGGITILERAHREEEQQDICDILFKFSALDLQKRFQNLLDRIEEGFNVLIDKEKDILLQVSQFLEVYPEITGSSKVHDSTDLFSRVRAYSDFLSYELLVVITKEFLKYMYNVEIEEEFEEYLSVVQRFEDLLKIEHFANVMAFLPQQEQTTMATTTYLVFKLNRNWSNKTLKILRNLYSFLFSDNQRYLSHTTVDIVEKVPCIKFLIPNSTQIIKDLISEVAKKRELMYLLGVFEMMINNTPVLMEDEDKNFTFESAIQKAVQFGNNEAVQLLLDLSNVDRTHNESKPFPVASDPGHLSVDVTSLLSNLNALDDETGYPKLILASENGMYQMVDILLKKGADPNIRNENGETALILASLNGHYQVVEILLEKGADPNIHDNDGWTALIVASQNGHYQVVEILLEKGADPNIHKNNGWTALIEASQEGHYQVVEILLEKGADPNIHANDGWTALIVASQNGHQRVVELLLEKQVNPNVQNSKNGRTALIQASGNGHYQVIEILLEKGANPNIHDNDGWTALIVASLFGHYQVVEILLEKGADPNIHDNDGWTALIVASQNGHQRVVELLLEKQVNPNVQNSKNGRTTLIQASGYGHNQMVEILLEKGADPNIHDNDGWTALIVASQLGHYQMVEILLEKGADPNIHDNNGWTALIVASQFGHQRVVELLLEKQVNPNVQNSKNGRTALIQASQLGHYQMVEILLEKGADPNIRNEKGETALIVASQNGHYQVVEILLEKGADPNIHDNNGWTSLIVASHNGHQQVVELLLEEQVDPNVQNSKNGRTALIQASQNGHNQVVEILLEKGADPNIHDNDGWTALIVAIHDGHQQVVELLLEEQVDPNVQNSKNGRTALFLASQSGHYQVIEILLEKGADPNIHDNDGWTALIVASQFGHYQVVEILLEKGADPNIHDNDGWTALIVASQNGHQRVVELLLEKHVNPNVQNSKNGVTALIQASMNGHYQVVEILLKKGADPNIRNVNGETALILASKNGHYQVVEILLEKGADPNIHDNDGWTALIVGSENGYQRVVELLLEKQVDPNVQNSKNGRTALIQGSQGGHYQVVDKLLQKGADPNVHDNNGGTALMYSSMEGHSDIIEVLLRYNANPHYFVTSDEVSFDSLACAAMSGNIECLNIFLKHAELSLKSLSMGWHYACKMGHIPIIRLLSNRLDIVSDQRDLIISCVEGDLGSVVDQLMSGKITPDVQFVHGVTPLMISSTCGHTDIVEGLITAGANVNKTDEFGQTALDFAEGAEQDATKNILLQHGGIEGPVPENESHETTSEEQKLSTDTSQSTIKSSQDSLLIRKKELNTKNRPFLIMKKLFKDTVKYSQSIFSQHQRFDNREYSTTTHIRRL